MYVFANNCISSAVLSNFVLTFFSIFDYRHQTVLDRIAKWSSISKVHKSLVGTGLNIVKFWVWCLNHYLNTLSSGAGEFNCCSCSMRWMAFWVWTIDF